MKYEIEDLPGRLVSRGTWDKPYLHYISSGQKGGESLNFHIQVGLAFYTVGINQIGKKYIYFDCKTTGCKF